MSSIDPVNNFLRVVSLPSLETMRISVYKSPKRVQKAAEKDGWITFSRLLREATTARFRGLIVRSHLWERENDWTPIELDLSLSSLPDLLALPLTAFLFNFLHSISTTDVIQMVDSWKGLSCLDISSWCILPKFSIVIQIAAGLPCLIDLSLSVDCRELPAIDKTPLLCHRLRELELRDSRLQDPFQIARCLDRIFPHLSWTEFNSKNVKEQNLWNQALKFLEGLRQVRSEERRRIRRVKSNA